MSAEFPKFLHKKPKVLGLEIVDLFMLSLSILFVASLDGHPIWGLLLGIGIVGGKLLIRRAENTVERFFLRFSVKRVDWNNDLQKLRGDK